uniref:Uncharacterized protein n=1 Tax=Strix occidentalis caurina TaxID=311401 RepID=A0A8D0FRS9_STROC
MINVGIEGNNFPQHIKLSAEIKHFVPKHVAVTVTWSEQSEAHVFPRYLTTCYPFIQELSLVCSLVLMGNSLFPIIYSRFRGWPLHGDQL